MANDQTRRLKNLCSLAALQRDREVAARDALGVEEAALKARAQALRDQSRATAPEAYQCAGHQARFELWLERELAKINARRAALRADHARLADRAARATLRAELLARRARRP